MFHDFSPKIHKSGWTIVKTVYLICRFTILTSWPFVVYILMTDHDADDCTPWEYPQEIIYIVLQISPQCLLLSRTWVFTGRKKSILWVFSILLLSYFASNLWINIKYMELYKGPHHQPSPELCLYWLTVVRHRAGFVRFGALGVDLIATAAVIYCYICDPSNRGKLLETFYSQAIIYVFLMIAIDAFSSYANIFTPGSSNAMHLAALVVPNLLHKS
ncbi:hypothetical protein AX14_008229 [Amanita brunnescens Koide BX004]|nr:hypothetical protein AX14_008229 [Amanita brunnescens Koide BX004]